MRPWHAHDIYIPKLPKRTTDGAYLTLSETLQEPVSYCHSLRHLTVPKAGLAVEDNDPGIIRDAVAEMLMQLDGGASSDADVADVRMRADEISPKRIEAFRHGQAFARLSAPSWRFCWVIAGVADLRSSIGDSLAYLRTIYAACTTSDCNYIFCSRR